MGWWDKMWWLIHNNPFVGMLAALAAFAAVMFVVWCATKWAQYASDTYDDDQLRREQLNRRLGGR